MRPLIELENRLFEKRSRYLLLYLTLAYKIEYRAAISLERVKKDQKAFFGSTRGRLLFKKIQGYAWKIELGETADDHYHVHVLIWYDGEFRDARGLSLAFGQVWQKITQGQGYCKSSNVDLEVPSGCDPRVLGTIDRNNVTKRHGLLAYYNYFTKDEQRVPSGQYVHLFGCSQTKDRDVIIPETSSDPHTSEKGV